MCEVINLLHYFTDEQIAEVKAEYERQLEDIQRKLAVIAIEEARRNEL